ncbi:CPBP family intramembrane metalloprotease [Nocardioides sp. TRM66260-LWL]|uniref:CPBP family glutamic-type intramembrane protease n=1 Tax=Nocardioides sp. TRM66260-LWL TaxID=2874478 RepID=UPI001CC34D29|nr:CPBP family glutamic-type intramembrane protease [Nocardioides sp. TRM66260-LWL]MBZ5736016.1 CPBP family intramembrane metalloprotease [Nocardioides sp. TRM66260-LWL]
MKPLPVLVRRSLWDVVPRDQRDTDAGLRRRQWVTAGFLVLGGAVLAVSLRIEPGSVWFYPATLLLAAVWIVGALVSGRLHLGRIADLDRPGGLERPILPPFLLGAAMVGVFVLGGLTVRALPFLQPLEDQISNVLALADAGSLPVLFVITAINGIAEELFFRGAAYAAIPHHPVLWTTVAYTIATLATGNVMLSFAALLLGLVAGLQRRASGGILAPAITHLTWSLSMLVVLPAIF